MILYRSHPISYSSRQDRYAGRSTCYYRIIKRNTENGGHDNDNKYNDSFIYLLLFKPHDDDVHHMQR